ncbi:MAG: FHA domain-containing protein, partial [Candidatus Eiseniibacteriota bacterium]
PKVAPYPAEGQTTAILFLVDTSDPARKKVVDAVVRDIGAMIAHAKSFHRFGLATFDSAITMRAEVGANAEAMKQALASVRAAGQRTELFRRGAEAVLKLAQVKATRKALFLFSDGRAEDDPKAYPLSYMADTALTEDVRVYTFCYTGVAPPPISCQNLSRLAEETGGVYVAASRALTLPAEATGAPFAGIDNGGRAIFDLTPAKAALIGGKRDLRLVAELARERSIFVAVPVVLPPVPFFDRAFKSDNLPWTVAALAAVLTMIGLSIYAALFLLRQRQETVAQQHPVAYLEFLDGNGTRYPMVGSALRIGRAAGNEVRLANTSVSAHHAEIHRRRDGGFVITDLKSMNGVTINDAKIATAELKDGDEIDLGEVRFRFVLNHEAPAMARAVPVPAGHVDGASREP